jgi:Zn-dependent M16 (insulinase) family peptidase
MFQVVESLIIKDSARQYVEMFVQSITKFGTERFKVDTVSKLLNLSSTGFEAKLESIRY